MSAVTYFMVQPYRMETTKKGKTRLVAGEAREVKAAGEAIRAAQRYADLGGAGVAFSRRGDPTTGEFEDAVILGAFGPVPEEAAA